MAAPTKNFIDPTYLSRLGPVFPAPEAGQLRMPLANFFGVVPRLTPAAGMIPFLVKPGPYFPPAVVNRIPTPPMGKLVILTFPPIYRERTGVKIGQIYPPPAP